MSWKTIAKEVEKSKLIPDLIKQAEEYSKKVLVISTPENKDVNFPFNCTYMTFDSYDNLLQVPFYELEYYDYFIFHTQWDLNKPEHKGYQYRLYDNLIGKDAVFLVCKG